MKKYLFRIVRSTSHEKAESTSNMIITELNKQGWLLKEHRLTATDTMGATVIVSFVFEKDE